MNYQNLFKIAIRAIAANKMRSFLTALGIIIGIAAVITMLAIGQGSKASIKANIAEILKREGYIKDFTAKEAKVGQTLEVTLKYGPNGERSIQGIKRISKPGLRRYAKSDSLPMPLGGLGIAIISTSSGLLTQKECLDRGIGGEIVAFVW